MATLPFIHPTDTAFGNCARSTQDAWQDGSRYSDHKQVAESKSHTRTSMPDQETSQGEEGEEGGV